MVAGMSVVPYVHQCRTLCTSVSYPMYIGRFFSLVRNARTVRTVATGLLFLAPLLRLVAQGRKTSRAPAATKHGSGNKCRTLCTSVLYPINIWRRTSRRTAGAQWHSGRPDQFSEGAQDSAKRHIRGEVIWPNR